MEKGHQSVWVPQPPMCVSYVVVFWALVTGQRAPHINNHDVFQSSLIVATQGNFGSPFES